MNVCENNIIVDDYLLETKLLQNISIYKDRFYSVFRNTADVRKTMYFVRNLEQSYER